VALPVTVSIVDMSPRLEEHGLFFYAIAGHKTSSTWNIKNTGLTNLTWKFTSMPDDVTPMKVGGTLTPGQSDQITFYLDGLPQAGVFQDTFTIQSNQTNTTSTFYVSMNIRVNGAPGFPDFPASVAIKVQDPSLRISLADVRDPEGDKFAMATVSQFPAIAEAS